MRVPELMFLYLLLGVGVAVASYRHHGEVRVWTTLLWPLWLPSLLADPAARYDTAPAASTTSARHPAVARLEEVLMAWAPELADTVTALQRGLDDLEARLTALQAEVARPEHDLPSLRQAATREGPDQPVHQRRLRNVEALVALRDRLRDELATSLPHIEELSTRVQLARFRGGTVEGVGRQLAELVAAIDGTREVQQISASSPPTTLPS